MGVIMVVWGKGQARELGSIQLAILDEQSDLQPAELKPPWLEILKGMTDK